MLNYKLKSFLKFLRSNRVIEEYELLFDRMFDFTKILDLDDDSIGRIYTSNGNYAIVLYEEINGVKIPDNIYSYISGLKSKELQKYAVTMAIGKYNTDDSLRDIMSVCEGDSVASSRYAYSVAMSDKLDNIEDRREYLKLIANSEADTSIQMRDLVFSKGFLEKEDNLDLLKEISHQREYIARYMIKLYEDTKSVKRLPILSFAIGESQARYAYELLRNDDVMSEYNSTLVAFWICESELDDAYRVILLVRDNNYKDLYEKAKKLLKKEEKDVDIDKLFGSRDINKIISGLSYISDGKDIKRKIKA